MAQLKEVIGAQIVKISPSLEELSIIGLKAKQIIHLISANLKKLNLKADVFIGGSFAKNTLIKKQKYDVDIFVRFDLKYSEDKLSSMLARVMPKNAVRIHGSRDYFSVKEGNIDFEIIPTFKIKNPSDAKNITDLSYFHVNYIENKLKKNKKLANEIRLAKAFLYYQGCYGAESYINGFSGYAVELIISVYGSFVKFLNAAIKSDTAKSKIILDSEKHYKNKDQILREMNESKLLSPIILIDPTFRDRNALAALSNETFDKFRGSAARFMKNPSDKFFEFEDKEEIMNKKYSNRLVKIEFMTDKQAGDIAGTKLKKFSGFFLREAQRYFDIKDSYFTYDESKNVGRLFVAVLAKNEIVFPGPPVEMKKALAEFKKEHKKIKILKGKAYAYEKNNLDFDKFLKDFQNTKSKYIDEMDVSEIIKQD